MPRSIIALLLSGMLFSPAQAREPPRSGLYGAIAYDASGGNYGFAVDRRNSRDARLEALRQCGQPKCEVVARLRADCGALAKGARKSVVQRGTTRQEAESKALRRCGEGCEIVVWACTR